MLTKIPQVTGPVYLAEADYIRLAHLLEQRRRLRDIQFRERARSMTDSQERRKHLSLGHARELSLLQTRIDEVMARGTTSKDV